MKVVEKVWGHEKILTNKPQYAGKQLFFKENHFSDWSYFLNRDRTYFVRSGTVVHLFGSTDKLIESFRKEYSSGEVFTVLPGQRSRIVATQPAELIELSTHHYPGDEFVIEEGGKL